MCLIISKFCIAVPVSSQIRTMSKVSESRFSKSLAVIKVENKQTRLFSAAGSIWCVSGGPYDAPDSLFLIVILSSSIAKLNSINVTSSSLCHFLLGSVWSFELLCSK